MPDYSRQGAHQSFQESMERMGGLDGVHTLRLHDPDSIEGGMEAAVSADGLIAGLRELREQLQTLRPVALSKRARADGVSDDLVEEAVLQEFERLNERVVVRARVVP